MRNSDRNYIGCVLGKANNLELNVPLTATYISTQWVPENGYEEIYPLRINQYGLYVKATCLCDLILSVNLNNSPLANIAVGFRTFIDDEQSDSLRYFVIPESNGGHNVYYLQHIRLPAGATLRPIILKIGDAPAIVKNATLSAMAISN